PARFCLFRSKHSRAAPSWVHHVPRTGRANADDRARKHALHGVVPPVPQTAGALRSTVARPCRSSTQADELLDMSSMKTEHFWRTLDEYSNFEEFQKSLQDEFAAGATERPASLDRREFLSLVGSSLAFAGLTSCAPTVP